MSDSHDYLVKNCDSIANEIELCADNMFYITNDDGEEENYFGENYNLDLVYRVGFGLIGVRIMVACGGPNIWVDTMERAVCGYWGSDEYKAYLTYDTCDKIVSLIEELYEDRFVL